MTSFPVSISLGESSEELESVVHADGTGGGFVLSCGTGLMAESQFGYVMLDLFFSVKPAFFVIQK